MRFPTITDVAAHYDQKKPTSDFSGCDRIGQAQRLAAHLREVMAPMKKRATHNVNWSPEIQYCYGFGLHSADKRTSQCLFCASFGADDRDDPAPDY
jgi:hypothetical protein